MGTGNVPFLPTLGFFLSAFLERKACGQELGKLGELTAPGLWQMLLLSPSSPCEAGTVLITDGETEAETARVAAQGWVQGQALPTLRKELPPRLSSSSHAVVGPSARPFVGRRLPWLLSPAAGALGLSPAWCLAGTHSCGPSYLYIF